MLEPAFWTFLGYVVVVGALFLIFAIGVGNVIHFGNPFEEGSDGKDFDGEWR